MKNKYNVVLTSLINPIEYEILNVEAANKQQAVELAIDKVILVEGYLPNMAPYFICSSCRKVIEW